MDSCLNLLPEPFHLRGVLEVLELVSDGSAISFFQAEEDLWERFGSPAGFDNKCWDGLHLLHGGPKKGGI